MKNLENYGVQTLNAKEIRETGGGSLLLGYLAGAAATAYLLHEALTPLATALVNNLRMLLMGMKQVNILQ